MLEYGLKNFMNYPWGGLIVHGEGYDGIWFHNMLLDIVRYQVTILCLYGCSFY